MPIRSSGYFNSPAFAQAASNLSALFEPPSGADAAGWAGADAKRAEASRLQQLFDYRNDPNFNQQSFDRGNIAVGNYAPTSSYQAQDQNDATKRRGDDITAATSRSNNAADNARAIDVEKLSGLQKFYGNLGEGDIRPEVPAAIATQFGAPDVLPQTTGAPKPLSETELKAKVLAGMPQNMQEAAAFGSTPIDAIATPDGPRNALRPDAVGQVPYDAPKGAGMSIVQPDGTTITMGGSGKGPTEFQGKQDAYATRMEGAAPVIDQFGSELTSYGQAGADALPTVGTIKLGNGALSENYQKASNAGEMFLTGVLRLDSGAAIPPAEAETYGRIFLPRPGDKPGTIAQKSYARKLALEGIKAGMTPEQIKAVGQAVLAAGGTPDAATPPAAAATGAPAAAPAPAGAVRHYNPATGKIE